ncbi:hypothetical protein F480_07625 [Bibersteinia trehalosi Y31]|uniref:Uncharacterized protein n=1 Tax=Bibersteinia trehalosi Y31 TaxID=1261658 RepID=A0A179CYC3_BIBTR|nr:hypothetical protein [Bibersteinia trehalosi]OAQ14915.1 hypothetical protein F480_07625 [Bibersteinia trehalosi Y31]
MNSPLIKTTIVFVQRHLLKIMLSIALISYYLYIIFFYSAEELKHKPKTLNCNDIQEVRQTYFSYYYDFNKMINRRADICRIENFCDIWVLDKDISHKDINKYYINQLYLLEKERPEALFLKMLENFSFRKYIEGEDIENKTFIFDNFGEVTLFNAKSIYVSGETIYIKNASPKGELYGGSVNEPLIMHEKITIQQCE